MAKGEKGVLEAGIARLDSNANAHPNDTAREAAALVGLDLQAFVQKYCHEKPQSDPLSSSFQEQWLLRWILKTLDLTTHKSSPSTKPNSSHKYWFSAYFWALLLHLLLSIPRDVCLEILLERKFYHNLEACLRYIHLHADSTEGADSTAFPPPVQRAEEGPPSKKRRLSANRQDDPSASSTNPPQPSELRVLLLQVVSRSIEMVSELEGRQKPAASLPCPTWTPTWTERASLVATALNVAIHLYRDGFDHSVNSLALEMSSTILSLWTIPSVSSGSQDLELNEQFNSLCLMPCLEILGISRNLNSRSQTSLSLKKMVERLVAVHVVLPARTVFIARHGKKRMMKSDYFWKDVEPLVKDLHKKIFIPEDLSDSNRFSLLVVYDIAVRIVQTADLRKRQSEQQWLDYLFLALSHEVCPQLPRVTASGDVIDQSTTSTLEVTSDTASGLKRLLTDVSATNIRPSLPAVGYILASFLAWNEPSVTLRILPQLVGIDINVILPPAGMSKSEIWLDQVCTILTTEEVTHQEFTSIRDCLLLPLVRAYARSRRHENFAKLWEEHLAEAMRARYSMSPDNPNIPAVLVWEDEDTFDQFKVSTTQHAPQGIAQTLLTALYEPFLGIASKAGSILGLVAKAAVFTACLESLQDQSEQGLPAHQLIELIKATVAAVAKRSDYQGQRWRLWRFIRVLASYLPMTDVVQDIEKAIKDQFEVLSIATIAASSATVRSRPAVADNLEYLECFTLVTEFSDKSHVFTSLLLVELNQLQNALGAMSKLGQTNESTDAQSLWNGRSSDLTGTLKVASACVGCLLQRPRILSTIPSASELVIPIILKLRASEQYITASHPDSASPSLWNALLDVEQILESSATRKLILDQLGSEASVPLQPETVRMKLVPYLSSKELRELNSHQDIWAKFSHHQSGERATLVLASTPIPVVKDLLNRLDKGYPQDTPNEDAEMLPSCKESDAENITNDYLNSLVSCASSFVDGLAIERFSSYLSLIRLKQTLGDTGLIYPILAATLISRVTDPDLIQHPDLAAELGEFSSTTYLRPHSSSTNLLLALETCKLVLDEHPLVVNQKTLDRLLVSLCELLSASSETTTPALAIDDENRATDIYNCICAIMGSVLGRFRRRLSDRYHLLLPVLQKLLRGLFWPGAAIVENLQKDMTAYAVTTFGKSLPRWLRDSEKGLPPSSAEKFTRLLSSICNPTVSAARSSKKGGHNALNDQTKKAKKLAGQYMQYVVQEYARCSLDGQISPVVKERLMPGLFAIMNAMDRDLMRASNAAMDPSTRVIFKTLYDEWLRFGKWDKS